MRDIALCCVLLTVGGCATPKYGNFVETAPADQTRLAGDVVRQLAAMYPPARTRLELQQPTQDPFGLALVQGLRSRGYAVQEYHPATTRADAAPAAATDPAEPASPAGLTFRYVLDKAGDSKLYHLTMRVGPQTITRAYTYQDGAFAPASYWARGE